MAVQKGAIGAFNQFHQFVTIQRNISDDARSGIGVGKTATLVKLNNAVEFNTEFDFNSYALRNELGFALLTPAGHAEWGAGKVVFDCIPHNKKAKHKEIVKRCFAHACHAFVLFFCFFFLHRRLDTKIVSIFLLVGLDSCVL